MDPKKINIPKIEFQSTEDRTKKIVAIMRMLKESSYSELRVLPDSELNMLFNVLETENITQLRRSRHRVRQPNTFFDAEPESNDWTSDEVMPF